MTTHVQVTHGAGWDTPLGARIAAYQRDHAQELAALAERFPSPAVVLVTGDVDRVEALLDEGPGSMAREMGAHTRAAGKRYAHAAAWAPKLLASGRLPERVARTLVAELASAAEGVRFMVMMLDGETCLVGVLTETVPLTPGGAA